jgi:DNA-binding SARP family transcriptional activator
MRRSIRLPAKLSPPRLQRIVRRERVIELLDRALGTAVWIAAPAGYGKTTAAADYLEARKCRSVWYRADTGDLDPANLFHYLDRAVSARAHRSPLPRFGPEYADQLAEFSKRFFRAFFARVPDGTTVVVDDLHKAALTLVPAVVGAALSELPPGLQLLLLSRESPPSELTPALASGRLQLLDTSALAFTRDETHRVAGARLPAHVAQATADRLHEVTHGWPAELVLVCAAIERDPASIGGLAAHSREAAFRLFALEFFEALPETERQFMLLTSRPAYVTPASAMAMTGCQDAGAMLESFCTRQLFVTRAAGMQRAYRYHDLFRDFLRHAATALDPAVSSQAARAGAQAFLAEGDHDAGIALALDGGLWDLAATALIRHAATLIRHGRRATLLEAAGRLPDHERAGHPELAYWLGVACMIEDEQAACSWFEQAHRAFALRGDGARMLLTAAQAVLAIHMSWHSYVGKDIWLQRLAACQPGLAAALSPSDKLRIATASLRAAGMGDRYTIDSDTIAGLAEDMLTLLALPDSGIEVDDRFVAADALQEYASESGRREVFDRAVAAVIQDLRHPELTPWAKINWLISFGMVSGRRFPGSRRGVPFESADDAVAEANALAEREGFQSLEFSATYARAALANARGDETAFRRQVEHLEKITDARHPVQLSNLMQLKAGVLLAQEDYVQAMQACANAVDAGERGRLPPSQMWAIRLVEAQVFIAAGREDEASALMMREAGTYEGVFRKACEIVGATARLRTLRPRTDLAYGEALGALVAQIKALGWVNYLSCAPKVAAEIWSDALELGIERGFLCHAIRQRGLKAPRSFAPAWPWPLRVRLMGDMGVEIDGEPLEFVGKVQRKPLELLRYIALHHPLPAPVRGAIAALWPDAGIREGKAALDVALHRLRRLVGADYVLVSDGNMRLDATRSWVDAGAFEQWVEAAKRQLDEHGRTRSAKLASQLFAYYRGPLYGGDAVPPWALASRERLHAHFEELAASLGRYHECTSDWPTARSIYERAIALDPLAEEFYRGLMRCHAAAEEPAEVMRAFRRCRETLSIVLGVAPAPETVRLLSRLRDATG